MGLLDGILKIGAPIVGGLLGGPAGAAIGGALGGAFGGGSSQTGTQTVTNQNKLDPRIDGMLFGQNGQPGMLSQYQSMLNSPQGLKDYQSAGSDYLSKYAGSDMGQMHDAAGRLLNGNSAALAAIPSYAVGSQIKAPSQNSIDLTPTYQSLLSGGNNAALRDSLKFGTDLTSAQFQKNQTDLTNNLMRNVMPSIRSNSVLAGQYGGSRQGVAEGNALSDYTNQLTNANTQIGLANSANTTGQLANDYQQGQDRALAAAQSLGSQQYSTAAQNAATNNAAEFMNVGNQYDASKFNASTVNGVNGQNNAAMLGGSGLLSGLGANAAGAANSDVTRAHDVNGLLTPYLAPTGSSTENRPLYQSTAGNMVGGLMLGNALLGGGGSGNASAQPLDGLMKFFNIGPSTIG
jgi:hypothetical protein